MTETTCCPDCGAELPTGATGGLCPRCLLGAGLNSDEGQPLHADSPFAATTPQAGGFVPPTPASLAGSFPDLEILEIIGQGGMGAVYKARQTKLDRLVALKVIRPESADDPAFAERFTREARTLARLSHSNIVAIHDFGELDVAAPSDPDAESVRVTRTLFYFVMEFVDGANLRQLMESGQLQPAQSLAIVPQICDALQYAHDEGIVHRDIKPENILIDRRGRVKIADFGLAKLAGQSPENFTLTGTHQVMGTPRYMAPEQMGGSKQVDHRADIYSLGVVLYEMLTGELPMGRFEAPSQKVAVDVRLDDVVHRALESNPDRRYQRASEIRTEMEAIAFDALSQGEFESLDGSIASGFPGPSTIMERQVAGVVNWFKRGGSPVGKAQAVRVSTVERDAIRQQVRGPAVALLLLGGVAVVYAGMATVAGWQMLTGGRFNVGDALNLLLFGAVMFVLGGLAIRGGWHLLTLDNYRAAFLGALIGQPVGIWALTRLSRDEVRAAFRTVTPPPRRLSVVSLLITLCGVLIAGGGIAITFQPWAEILNTANREWFSAAGFAWPQGMIACITLALIGMFLLATAAVRPVPVWRPIIVVLGALVVLGCCGSFVNDLNSGTLVVRPLLQAASWGVEVDGRTPVTIGDWNQFVVQQLDGVNYLMWIAVGLLVTSAFDLWAALKPAPEKRRRPTAATIAPGFSRKAIVGACWAPLFFAAAAGLMVTTEQVVRSPQSPAPPGADMNMLLVIPASVVGIFGLLAPFATTILGMMAISDIRHAPTRIRGLGLAYFDAIFFPLLVLDAVLLFGLGVALSMIGSFEVPWMVSAMFLGAPVCLVLDSLIAAWGWRRLTRSVRTPSPVGSRQSVAAASDGLHVESTQPAAETSAAAQPPILAPTPPIGTDSSLSSLEIRRLEIQLKAPAAGLMVVAFLHLLFWLWMGGVTLFEAWGMHRGRFDGTPVEVLGAIACAIVVLLVVGTIFQGARHLRRLTGIGWCYAAAIFSVIPWSGASVVGIFVGIWVFNMLARPEIKEAFVQRSLELEQRTAFRQ